MSDKRSCSSNHFYAFSRQPPPPAPRAKDPSYRTPPPSNQLPLGVELILENLQRNNRNRDTSNLTDYQVIGTCRSVPSKS